MREKGQNERKKAKMRKIARISRKIGRKQHSGRSVAHLSIIAGILSTTITAI
jgi:hypothetical protein